MIALNRHAAEAPEQCAQGVGPRPLRNLPVLVHLLQFRASGRIQQVQQVKPAANRGRSMSKAEGIAHSELTEKFKRFPLPEFDRFEFKGMNWQAPKPLSDDEVAKLIERQGAGDTSAYGC